MGARMRRRVRYKNKTGIDRWSQPALFLSGLANREEELHGSMIDSSILRSSTITPLQLGIQLPVIAARARTRHRGWLGSPCGWITGNTEVICESRASRLERMRWVAN